MMWRTGEPDARAQLVRELNRNIEFRKAISVAIDRQRLGDSLVRGPFTAIYPGGLYAGTAYYDKASTVYYPYDLTAAKAAGLTVIRIRCRPRWWRRCRRATRWSRPAACRWATSTR